ncbi:hypothetical protein SE9_02534 [Enterococcus faecium EnGen0126]|nr:hypothetical protein SE9_02534 [Enterococcus faecium EnGen0126]
MEDLTNRLKEKISEKTYVTSNPVLSEQNLLNKR